VTTYGLPAPLTVLSSHDDMQAVVAALVAAAAAGGPARPASQGIASKMSIADSGRRRRLEGFIWNVEPLTGPRALAVPLDEVRDSISAKGAVCVTQAVLDQVARFGLRQSQIAIRNPIGGTKASPKVVEVGVESEAYRLVVGDTHAAWRSHQTDATRDSFERLFAILADRPNQWSALSFCRVLENPPMQMPRTRDAT